MQQDDLIDSIENPTNEPMNSQENRINSAPKEITPLPEDLIIPKKEINVFGIINLISYITLGLAALFLLILYIIGLMK
ncbi:MAG: hypothetical protein WC393_02380 [Candidatus Nanoarchaeia archaeon]|jgi:hypothetical protein